MVCLQMACCCPLKILDWRREEDELLLPVVLKAAGQQSGKETKEEVRKEKLAVLLVGLVLELVFAEPVLSWFLSPLHLLVCELFPVFPSYLGSPLENWQTSPGAPSLSSWAAEWVRTSP